MTRYYLDTSVAVHALLVGGQAARWFDSVTADPHHELVSSRILQTEITRVLRREGKPVADREGILEFVGVVQLSDVVLSGAEAITEHVKTLDAIHLATAIRLGSRTVLVSHDAALLRLGSHLGLQTFDPITAGP